ncbi:MAG: hypothetical protein NT154_32890 [Verrucomicrobia bacterium]|nr:hypothetical protein [Verrucomicrobiota bacterium]
MKIAALVAMVMVFGKSEPLRATTLVGTQVKGALYFPGYELNYFDPANGRVPAGYLNTNGTTVTISTNAVEFGYDDGTATITADFTDIQLTVTEHPQLTAHHYPIQMVFTNAVFSSLSKVSDSFPSGGMTASLSGNVINLNWAGGDVTSSQTYQVVFNVNAPASPLLSIQLTPTKAVSISWPASSSGFKLQQNPNLNSTAWANVTNTVVIENGQNQVVVSPQLSSQFFRLRFP